MHIFKVPTIPNELIDSSFADQELLQLPRQPDIRCLLMEGHTPKNRIKALTGATNLQAAQRTEEHAKLHYREAVGKVQTMGTLWKQGLGSLNR